MLNSVEQVAAANAALQKAIDDKDIAAINALYADDCDLLSSNVPLIRDRESILDFYRNLFKDPDYQIRFWSIRMIPAASDDLVVDVGQVVFEPSNGEKIPAKYTVTWRKHDDGRWLMIVDSVSPDV